MTKNESLPTLTIESPPLELSDAFSDLSRLGHSVVDLAANSQDIKVIKDTIKATYPVVFPTVFTEYCTYHGLNNNWPMRLWNGLLYYQNKAETAAPQRYIDMRVLREQIRGIERGQFIMEKFGQDTWDIFAGLNNENEADPDNYILPWHKGIHDKLRLPITSPNHISAVKILEELYKMRSIQE